MLLMFAALVVLYEGSLLIARVVLSRRIKAQTVRLHGLMQNLPAGRYILHRIVQ